MGLFNKIFKRKPYTFLGRAGMTYSDKENKYHINTENFLGKPGYDLAIYWKDIKLMNQEKMLSESEKKKIAIALSEILKTHGLEAEILPI